MNDEAQIMMLEPTVSADRIRIGKFLYAFAWIIEVFAITIGFAIAMMTMYSSFSSLLSDQEPEGVLNLGDYTNIFIATLPFIMVSIVEATKIPFVEAYYKTTSLVWKWIFGLSLLFITFITFESASNGFERNFNALMYSIDKPKKQLIHIDETIKQYNDKKEYLSSLSIEKIESEYNDRYGKLNVQTGEQRNSVNERITSLRATITTEYVKSRQDLVKQKLSDKESLISQRDQEVSNARSRYQKDIESSQNNFITKQRSLQNQLSEEEKRLSTIMEEESKKIRESNFITESSVERDAKKKIDAQRLRVDTARDRVNEFDPTIQENMLNEKFNSQRNKIYNVYGSKIRVLDDEIADLQDEIANAIGTKEKEVEDQVRAHEDELRGIEGFYNGQLGMIKATRDEDIIRLKNNDKNVDEIDSKLFLLSKDRVELRNFINQKVGDNQIYRMAQWWTSKESAADVTRGEVLSIAMLWFGSLAVLIACTGIILAAASLVIQDPAYISRYDKQQSNQKNSITKLIHSIRSAVISARKRFRNTIVRIETVEVVKEVIVEKVVIKEVEKEVAVNKVIISEVPVEVIKKEVVHVPFYTNDMGLLNLSAKSDAADKITQVG